MEINFRLYISVKLITKKINKAEIDKQDLLWPFSKIVVRLEQNKREAKRGAIFRTMRCS